MGYNVLQKVAAGCLWLASKLEECPKKARQVIIVFHRMECRRESLPIEHLDLYSKVRRFYVPCIFDELLLFIVTSFCRKAYLRHNIYTVRSKVNIHFKLYFTYSMMLMLILCS